MATYQTCISIYNINILVVDNGSTDNSQTILNELLPNYPFVSVVHVKHNQGYGHGILEGLKSASGEIIVILSAHSFVHSDFIKNSVLALDETDAICVGGPIENIGSSYIGKAIALAMKSLFGVGNSLFRTSRKRQYVDTVAFGAYRKEVFKAVGYFDESLVHNQDFEFNQRILKFGSKILLTPEITSYYYARNSLPQLFTQYFNYGYWKEQVIRKNTSSFKLRYQIPVLFITVIISLAFGGFYFTTLWNYLGLILIGHAGISLLFSILTGKISSYKYIPVLSLVFITLHFAFGFGFIGGIFRNIMMKK